MNSDNGRARRVVVAVDLGTKCGVAAFKDGQINACTQWLLPSRNYGCRAAALRQQLAGLIDPWLAGAERVEVVYEDVRRHLGADAAHCYGALLGALEETCNERGIIPVGYAVGTIKKTATGRGNATKDQMVRAAWNYLSECGHKPLMLTDNMADALWIGLTHLRNGDALRTQGQRSASKVCHRRAAGRAKRRKGAV